MPVFQANFLYYEAWIGPGTAWANEVRDTYTCKGRTFYIN